MASRLLFAIGASGVGKTAAIRALAAQAIPGLSCHEFDSVGVPSVDDMVSRFGTGERWQEVTTHQWIDRLRADASPMAILEGQTRPSFIRPRLGHLRAGIVLLDCEPQVRSQRLCTSREQPELDTAEMHSWAAYLRGQAEALGLPIIDTTARTPDEVADELLATPVVAPFTAP